MNSGRRWAFRGLVGVLAILWFVFLRPTSLGGSTAYVVVAGDSMLPTYADGTLVVSSARESYQLGDVITFAVDVEDTLGSGRPLVIHRIVGGDAVAGYTTHGDNRPFSDPWTVKPADIVGRDAFAIPGAGQLLLVLRSPIFLASVAAGLATYIVLGLPATRTRPRQIGVDGGQAPAT